MSTPAEVIRDATTRSLSDRDGKPITLKLRPGMSDGEIESFAAHLPCPLPPDIRELLALCTGFEDDPIDLVDFTGRDCRFEFSDALPHGHPIAADGFGNFWVVDLLPDSTHWGPIYFACHDAPVMLYQGPTLEHFLVELFKLALPPHKSLVDDVHEDRLFHVWRKNPGVVSQQECLQSEDADIRQFARQLDGSFQIVDLRSAQVGFGFSWGRYGPKTIVRRFAGLPIFAYQKPPGLFHRIFR